MTEPSSDLMLEYDTWRDGDVWHARRKATVSDEQAAHGVEQVVTADTVEELEAECIAQRIKASWYAS